jgi:multidrug efflux pump subunit AcrA (membrane-fusion protein)
VIPRNALVVINGEYYAFVAKDKEGDKKDLFERRKLEIEQENSDIVIVKKGLKAGEKVVSNGAVMLGQKFEDLSTVDTGSPAQ